MIKRYFKKIKDIYERGDAREESFYSILKELIEEYANKIRKDKISITTLPKKTEGGNPDFRIWSGKNQIIGYIEAKNFDKDLNQVEITEQLIRYRDTFPNLILTNFFEFRLYRDGKLIDEVEILKPFDVFNLKTVFISKKKEKEFFELLDKFFSFSTKREYTPESLAITLAKKTRFLKDIVYEELKEGDKRLKGFYEMFKKYLIFELSEDDFSDLYSQTITYGLFAARMRSTNEFNRREPFSYALVSDLMVESCVFESAFANNTLCPLYLYPSVDKNHMFKEKKKGKRKVNLNPEVSCKLKETYKKDIAPEEIFNYIYGVLYSNIYREKYKEFLRIDFPRIPFTSDYKLFTEIGNLGKELVELHLLKSREVEKPISKFHGKGLNLVEKVKYDDKEGRVYINKNQFFDGIDKEVWNYMIGGYQVLNKWLKDRKGRYLSLEEIKIYPKIVTSIKKTIEIQKEIDKLYPLIEETLLSLKIETTGV